MTRRLKMAETFNVDTVQAQQEIFTNGNCLWLKASMLKSGTENINLDNCKP